MKFDEFDKHMRIYEQSLDQVVLPDIYIAARLDGRSFTKLTKEICQWKWYNTAVKGCRLSQSKAEYCTCFTCKCCIVASTYNKLEIPSLKEGFHKLNYVKMENGGFVIEDWSEDK